MSEEKVFRGFPSSALYQHEERDHHVQSVGRKLVERGVHWLRGLRRFQRYDYDIKEQGMKPSTELLSQESQSLALGKIRPFVFSKFSSGKDGIS